MKRNTIFVVLLAIVLISTACAPKRTRPTDMSMGKDPAITALSGSITQIDDALKVLKNKQNIRESTLVTQTPTDPRLTTPITMRAWNGPAKKALDFVGMLIGYSVITTGKTPAIEPLVSLNAAQVPAAQLLQDIGIQIGSSAGIQVDEPSATITLVYEK